MLYFEVKFSNGYCGCDEYTYIKTETYEEAEVYAQEYLTTSYSGFDDASQCLDDIEDYEDEEQYWEDFEAYQAECSYDLKEISKQEYEEYESLD